MLVAVGNGSSAAVQRQIEGLGTNLITIMRTFGGFGFGGRRSTAREPSSSLTAADATALGDRTVAPDIKSVSPVVNGPGDSELAGRDRHAGPGHRHDASYFEVATDEIAPGASSPPHDEQTTARVAVLGQTVVSNLFGTSRPDRTVGQAQQHELPGDRGAQVKGLERDPGPGRHRPGTAHAAQDTLTGNTGHVRPDHRRGRVGGSSRPRRHRDDLDPRRRTHTITDGERATSASSTRRRCSQRRASSNHMFTRAARRRRRRSRCSSAASA